MEIANYIIEIERIKRTWDFKKAVKYVNELLKDNTNDYRLYEELADINLFLRNYNEALDLLKVAESLNPDSATGKYLKWYIYVTQWNTKKWIKLLEESNVLTPNNPEILRNLWWGYVMSNKFDKWVNILKRALNLLKWDPLIIEDLWVAFANIWDFKMAKYYLKQINKEDILSNFK